MSMFVESLNAMREGFLLLLVVKLIQKKLQNIQSNQRKEIKGRKQSD